MKPLIRITFIALLLCVLGQAAAQDFMLQGWYWDYPGTLDGHNWADTLRHRAEDLADAGFTYVWLPPLSRSSYGSSSNGYDPQDLYDLGEAYGGGATRFGTRWNLDLTIAAFQQYGIKPVADVIYNHRDGGQPENNPSVEGWIENYSLQKCQNGDNPYPSDRFRNLLTLGGTSGRGTGTYYFKIRSASQHNKFFNKPYKVYMWTNRVGWQNLPDAFESEPNGGGGCGEPNNAITLGRNFLANVDASGCMIDEFALTLGNDDFYAAGDNLYIVIANLNGDYSDHYIFELWYNGSNIQSALQYQTYTDFTAMPSGMGAMNYLNFKPNGSPTQLAGDWDWPWFFYDYDQAAASTRTELFNWTEWLWDDVGIRGLRMDAVKHFPPEFVGDLLDFLHDQNIDPGMVVGEFYDSNASTLKYWVDQVKSYMDADTRTAVQPRVFDFSLRQALKDACDTFGYDARNVFQASIVDAQGASGFDVVTFTDNHDFRDPGQFIANDPILAYAYILTNNQVGLPCVFYKDYINGGLKAQIDALTAAHRTHIYGASQRDYLSRLSTPYSATYSSGYPNTTLLYQLKNTPSGRDVLVAVNFAGEPLNLLHGVNMGAVTDGDVFVDVLGRSTQPTLFIDQGKAHVQLGARDYSVWVKGVQVRCRLFLEGPYDASTHAMNTLLNQNGALPLTSPFADDPRQVATIPAQVVDWVQLELRATADGAAIAQRSCFLRADGHVVDLDGTTQAIGMNAAPGSYYLVVRHRNHLAVMSAAAVTLSSSGSTVYDFSTGLAQYYGGDAKLLEAGVYGLFSGDANGSGQVQNDDKNDFWKLQVGLSGYRSADFNLNGEVQNDDKNDFWKANVGKGTQIP